MSRNYFISLCIALLCILPARAQEADFAVQFLANDDISKINIDNDAYLEKMKSFFDILKKEFNTAPASQKVAVLLVCHKTGSPTLEIYANPKLESGKQITLQQNLAAIRFDNTHYADLPVLISINIKKGAFYTEFPDALLPMDKVKKEYNEASIRQKKELNMAWAINEVLPILTAYQVSVDPKFAGVKHFGELVTRTDLSSQQPVLTMTSTNPDYWRAVLEMNVGNQLIPATKLFMHVAQGELDLANMYLPMVDFFSDPSSIPDKYLSELKERIRLFNQQVNEKIATGIAEHDKGNYRKAMAVYESLLADYPNSAWGQYELYYSKNKLDIAEGRSALEDRTAWDIAKKKVYACNPLYEMDVRASNGKEGYLLFRRQEIKELFKKKEQRLADVYSYADIALDLGVYDFAAQLFWYSFVHDKQNPKSLNRFLYCLEKLQVPGLKGNFKGDHAQNFKDIEVEKEKEMISSPLYRSFKN